MTTNNGNFTDPRIWTRVLVAVGHIPGGPEVSMAVASIPMPESADRVAEGMVKRGLLHDHPDAIDIETTWYDHWVEGVATDDEEEAPE